MWGMCILCSALIRLAVVYASHTASIYAVNRATVIYYTQVRARRPAGAPSRRRALPPCAPSR